MVVFTVNEQLLKKNNLNYDGVLSLFAVSDKSQGMGIGKDLLNQVKTYWKKTNTNHIYLFIY